MIQRYLNGTPIDKNKVELARLDGSIYAEALSSAEVAKAKEDQRKMKLPGKRMPEKTYAEENRNG